MQLLLVATAIFLKLSSPRGLVVGFTVKSEKDISSGKFELSSEETNDDFSKPPKDTTEASSQNEENWVKRNDPTFRKLLTLDQLYENGFEDSGKLLPLHKFFE